MFVVLVLACLLLDAAVPTECLPQLDGRIVGGEPVEIEQYPSQISLQLYERHRCGGSVISEDYILTAAHCTANLDPEQLTIRAGSSYYFKGGSVHNVEEIHEHPNYNEYNADYDIAVLKLKESLSLSAKIQPIQLPELNEDVPAGSESITIGWGKTQEHGAGLPEQLQAVAVPIVALDECRRAYGPYVTERMICAGFLDGGKDSCQGDSGGPLIVNGKIVGLTSWGRGCARPRYPGVYASVPNLRGFVHDVTGL